MRLKFDQLWVDNDILRSLMESRKKSWGCVCFQTITDDALFSHNLQHGSAMSKLFAVV
jgi:hypothetical protein